MDNTNPTPMTTPTPAPVMNTPQMSPKKSEIGPIIATVVIIILILAGSLYFWSERMKLQQANQSAMNSADNSAEMAASVEASQIQSVSTDDSLNAISAEAKATNVSGLTQ